MFSLYIWQTDFPIETRRFYAVFSSFAEAMVAGEKLMRRDGISYFIEE